MLVFLGSTLTIIPSRALSLYASCKQSLLRLPFGSAVKSRLLSDFFAWFFNRSASGFAHIFDAQVFYDNHPVVISYGRCSLVREVFSDISYSAIKCIDAASNLL